MDIGIIQTIVKRYPSTLRYLRGRALLIALNGEELPWKHMSPTHPGTGTPQSVHAGGGGGVASRLRGILDKNGGGNIGLSVGEDLGIIEGRPVLGRYNSDSRTIEISNTAIDNADKINLDGLLAHEMMHDKFRDTNKALKLAVNTAKDNGLDVDNFVNSLISDGWEISDYTGFHWGQTGGRWNDFAFIETICEINRIKVENGSLIDLPPNWVMVYEAVK